MRKNYKRKKTKVQTTSNGLILTLIVIVLIAIIAVIMLIFTASNKGGGLAGDVFSKSKHQSQKVKDSEPQTLRWEKAFRFGNSSEDDKPKGNFLQHQIEKNKQKKNKEN